MNDLLATLVFSSGAIAYISINPETLDVTQILFDRYCVGKLSGQTVTGGKILNKSKYTFILHIFNNTSRHKQIVMET